MAVIYLKPMKGGYMVNRLACIILIAFISNAYSNNFYEAFGQTNVFSLRAGNSSDPARIKHYQKPLRLKAYPAISISGVST
jgi:hypothetical protein